MRQRIDVLAVFDSTARYPRPLRFKIIEHGIKTTVNISNIRMVDWLGSGGVARIEYDCESYRDGRSISYKLLYFFRECRWEVEA